LSESTNSSENSEIQLQELIKKIMQNDKIIEFEDIDKIIEESEYANEWTLTMEQKERIWFPIYSDYLSKREKESLIKKTVAQERNERINKLLNEVARVKEKQEEYVLLADYYLTHYKIKSSYYTNEIWIYKEGVWVADGEGFLLSDIHEIIPYYSRSARNEIIEKIRISTFFYENPFDQKSIIVVKNGAIDLQKLLLKQKFFIKHNYDHMATRKLDVDYEPKNKCHTIELFLSDLAQGQKDEKAFRSYLLESIADCFNNHYESQKLHMFVGEGNNGKGTFLRLVKRFLGRKNVSSLGLGLIHEASFQVYTMENAMANIVGDTNDKRIKDSGMIKKLTGEDEIAVDVKNVRKPIAFTNKAKMFISSQFVPKVEEDNDGWYRRFIITDWLFQMNEDKKERNFEKKLASPKELSGLLNLVLEAYKNFSDRNFTYEIESKVTKEEKRNTYLFKSNPVKVFDELYLEDDQNSLILKAELYENYNTFQQINKLRAKNKTHFWRELRKLLPHINTDKRKDSKRYCEGIKMNKEWFSFLSNQNIKITEKEEKNFLEKIPNKILPLTEIYQTLLELNDSYTLNEIKNTLTVNTNLTNDEFMENIEELRDKGMIHEGKNGYFYAINISK
jgi:putative DNA primase/helicase